MRPSTAGATALRAIGLLGVTLPASAAPFFSGLGDLPGGITYSQAYAVSGNGAVVVGDGGGGAFRWQDGAIDPLAGGLASAHEASRDGAVIVGTAVNTTGSQEAVRWTLGSIHGLGALTPGGVSLGNGVSGNGSVVVGASTSGLGQEAFRWENGVMVGLGDLGYEEATNSEAYSVSADGRVIVGYGQGPQNSRAVRWDDGLISELEDLPDGGDRSIATEISADGSVIVGLCSSALGQEPCRWDSRGPVGLGDLPGGQFNGTARGVSVDGLVVVGESSTDARDEAFIWTADDGMRNLRLVLSDDLDLDLTGWFLETAFDVSDDGRTIVGWGINPSGDREGWIAIVPEPSSGALSAFATLGLVTLRAGLLKRRRIQFPTRQLSRTLGAE